MKNLKKWIAVLLSVVAVVSLLAACNDSANTNPASATDAANNGTTTTDNSTTTTKGNTSSTTEDALDIQTVAATLETLDSIADMQVKLVNNIGDNITVALKNLEGENFILYEHNAYNNFEYVFEVAGESVTCYYRTSQDEAFALMENADRVATNFGLALGYVLNMFIDGGSYGGKTYTQSADVAAKTGPAYTYLEGLNGEVYCKLLIDKTTGFIVKYETVEEQPYVEFEVLEINTTNADMPAYK